MVGEIKPIAALVGAQPRVREGRGLRDRARRAAARPRDQRREGHRPPRDHPDATPSTASTRCPTTTGASTTWSSGASSPSSIPTPCSRTRAWRRRSPSTSSAPAAGCCSSRAGAASTARTSTERTGRRRRRRGRRPAAAQARAGRERRRRARSPPPRRMTKPPRRYSDASLLGGDGDRRQARRRRRAARGDEGLGHRHAGDPRGDHRAPDRRRLHRARRPRAGVHREGPRRHPPARRAPADLAVADRRLGAPARPRSSTGEESRERFMARHRRSSPAPPSTSSTTKLKEVRIPRANLGPCPVCGHDIVENRKGFSCWSREDPGCGFVIWKSKAGKTLPPAVARELIATRPHREGRDRLQGPLGPLLPRHAGARCRPRRASGASSSTSRGPARAPSRPRATSPPRPTGDGAAAGTQQPQAA